LERQREHLVEPVPQVALGWIAWQHDIGEAPAFLIPAPAHDLDLNAVGLQVRPKGDQYNARWQHQIRTVRLAPPEQLACIGLCSACLLERFGQHRVRERLHSLRRLAGAKKVLCEL
jgi:hypothetical protein